MDLTVIRDNIEHYLRVKKMSADKASRLAGKPDAIRNIKRKIEGGIAGSGVTVEVLSALARVFEVTVDNLTTPRERINVRPVPGLRDEIVKKLAWLDRERERALEELAALDEAEKATKIPLKRKIR